MEKKYLIDNPKLMAEWNYEKNIDIDPSKITLGSDKKVWWLCKEGHTWSASVSNRAKGRGCPICCGKIVLTGYNDLATRHPSLSLDFDIKRNKINPQNVFAGGTKKYWWICPNGHSYQCSIHNRAIIKVGCPYCAGKSVEIGYNDLKSKYPDLAKEFNEEKNKINSEDVFMRSTKSYWWKCPKGHEYKMPVEKRVKRNHGCPYCSGHRVILGFNDLSTTHPQLFSEWDIEKNRPHKFTDFSHGSTYKAWWKCKNGHIYQTTINEKCGSNRGCPYCSNSQILTGYNDLATTNPEIALEWHPTKNKLNPTQVFAGSTHKYWWLCPMGHEYLATPNHRTSGTSCPTCNRERKISFPEKVIFYYVAKCFHNTKENYSADFENKMNLDIFVPELKLGIEYDGFHWHKNPQKDNIKNQECKKSNITLIRIREEGLPQLDGYSIDYYTKKNDFLNIFEFIKKMLNAKYKINVNFDINLERDMSDINSLVLFSEKKNNISTVCPELIKEWDFEKNSPLKIESLTKGSTKKVWWKCHKGHSWLASVNNRIKGKGCPYCANVKVLFGYNDLQTVNPSLSKEWNYEKNNGLTPMDVMPNSGKKVWWLCEKGHEWQTSPRDRNRGNGCPYCSNKKVLQGYNDLVTISPSLVKEWNYEKNAGLLPSSVTLGSNKKVWWLCKEGHEWKTTIFARSKGTGCPECYKARRKRRKNTN